MCCHLWGQGVGPTGRANRLGKVAELQALPAEEVVSAARALDEDLRPHLRWGPDALCAQNTASPANRPMEMVIQIAPAMGSPSAGGTIAALLRLILTSDICALSSQRARSWTEMHAHGSFDKQWAFRGNPPFDCERSQ